MYKKVQDFYNQEKQVDEELDAKLKAFRNTLEEQFASADKYEPEVGEDIESSPCIPWWTCRLGSSSTTAMVRHDPSQVWANGMEHRSRSQSTEICRREVCRRSLRLCSYSSDVFSPYDKNLLILIASASDHCSISCSKAPATHRSRHWSRLVNSRSSGFRFTASSGCVILCRRRKNRLRSMHRRPRLQHPYQWPRCRPRYLQSTTRHAGESNQRWCLRSTQCSRFKSGILRGRSMKWFIRALLVFC